MFNLQKYFLCISFLAFSCGSSPSKGNTGTEKKVSADKASLSSTCNLHLSMDKATYLDAITNEWQSQCFKKVGNPGYFKMFYNFRADGQLVYESNSYKDAKCEHTVVWEKFKTTYTAKDYKTIFSNPDVISYSDAFSNIDDYSKFEHGKGFAVEMGKTLNNFTLFSDGFSQSDTSALAVWDQYLQTEICEDGSIFIDSTRYTPSVVKQSKG